jgi:hypothetical protein
VQHGCPNSFWVKLFLLGIDRPPALAHVVNIIDPCRGHAFRRARIVEDDADAKIPPNLSAPRRQPGRRRAAEQRPHRGASGHFPPFRRCPLGSIRSPLGRITCQRLLTVRMGNSKLFGNMGWRDTSLECSPYSVELCKGQRRPDFFAYGFAGRLT